ncbi:hypothetical protein ACTHRC_04870 [Neisseria sp. P0001.S009]|uniref:hypothetical protein n=1 Tax=unclassified Neisseria TaxID=2623750 RepID=UPI003613118D
MIIRKNTTTFIPNIIRFGISESTNTLIIDFGNGITEDEYEIISSVALDNEQLLLIKDNIEKFLSNKSN